jgi:hypothetical protein
MWVTKANCFTPDPAPDTNENGLRGRPLAKASAHYAPWHFLNFFSLPHGQGSLRPTSFKALRTGS